MVKKSALQKIEDHEKLCRIMQKQTFEQIKEMRERIKRIEYMIVAGMGSMILALVMNYMKWWQQVLVLECLSMVWYA